MTDHQYIPVSPMTLRCPYCGAQPGQACFVLRGAIEALHLERIKMATAIDDIANGDSLPRRH